MNKEEPKFGSCPNCDCAFEGSTEVTGNMDATPKPGDYTVCFKCGFFLEFDSNLKVKIPSQKDLESVQLTQAEVWKLLSDTRDKILILREKGLLR